MISISKTTTSAFLPRIRVTGDIVHVVFGAGGAYYVRSTDGGGEWSSEFLLVSGDSLGGSLYNSPIAGADGNVFFVWQNRDSTGRITSIKLRRSTDGGESWLEPQIIATSGSGNQFFAPMVAADGPSVFVSVSRYVGFTSQFFLSRSTDSGVTWDSIHQVTYSEDGAGGWGDMEASNQSVFLVSERAIPPSDREIVCIASGDSGRTWTTEKVVSTIDEYGAWGPQLSVEDNESVTVCWLDSKYGSTSGFSGTVLFRRSTDNGLTWSDEVRVSPLPSAAFCGMATKEGVTHVVWDDEGNGHEGSIEYTLSTDGGLTWAEEQTIGDTLDINLDSSIDVGEYRVHVVWSSNLYGINDTARIFYRRGCNVNTDVAGSRDIQLSRFHLLRNYPNPFNNTTTVQYQLLSPGYVQAFLVDLLGKRVAVLNESYQDSGPHEIKVDGKSLSSGVYFFLLSLDRIQKFQPIVVLK
jgi:Neuraminidase (sialidase)